MGGILMAGGGTGGHIFPLLVVGRILRNRGWAVRFMGSRYGMEKRIVPRRGFPLVRLPIRGIAGVGGFRRGFRAAMVPVAIKMALFHLILHRPAAIFSTGGYASFPALAAGTILRVPSILLEQNAVPGTVTRVLAKRARMLYLGFPTPRNELRRPAEVVGNPVDPTFFAVPTLDEVAPPLSILVLGGSQGSAFLNRLVVEHAEMLADLDVELTLQAGHRAFEAVSQRLAGMEPKLRVVDFLEDLPSVLAHTHLVISRAGAMSVSELAAAARPALFIPFEGAYRDHQAANASFLAEQDAAWMIREEDARAGAWIEILRSIVRDPGQLAQRGAAARNLAHRDSAERIVRGIESIAEGGKGGRRVS